MIIRTRVLFSDYHFFGYHGTQAYGGWYNYRYECGIFAHLVIDQDNAYLNRNGSRLSKKGNTSYY